MGDEDGVDRGVRVEAAGDLVGVRGGSPLELVTPGLSTLMTAASSPPVPEAVSVITSLETPKTQFSPSVTRLMMSANAGPR